MKYSFDLWLDESGDFINQGNKHRNPSVVGGLLIKKNSFSKLEIIKIFGREYVHSNEFKNFEFGEFAARVLPKFTQKDGELVIFQNKEGLNILDGSTTYLNVLAEGIIQLMKTLLAEFEYVELNILIAVRLDVEKQDGDPGKIIYENEYTKRLKEKIILGSAKEMLSDSSRIAWEVVLGSARKDQRLMIADIVTNCWLTIDSKKFNAFEREKILSLYRDKYYFSLFENTTEAKIMMQVSNNYLADAIFEIYTAEESINKDKLLELVLMKMKILGDVGINVQLHNLKAKIEILIKIERNLGISKVLLENLKDDLLVELDKQKIGSDSFKLDVYLYLLTIYTHEGTIEKAEKLVKLCEECMINIANRWESVDYYFTFKIREVIHLMNCFDYLGAEAILTKVINSLIDTKEIFSVVDGLNELFDDIRSDILGKAIGTRLIIKSHTLRKDKSLYESALLDSEMAMNEFQLYTDKSRQYQHRSFIECEAGNYNSAISWLLKSANIRYEDNKSLDLFISALSKQPKNSKSYILMYYTRLMAEMIISGEIEFSDTLNRSLLKYPNISEEILESDIYSHPNEIIYWKLGSYHSHRGNIKASINYYNKAISICNKYKERLTMVAIGLGIQAELASVLWKNSDKYLREARIATAELTKMYSDFMCSELPGSMIEFFKSWEYKLDSIYYSNSADKNFNLLWSLSREITY